ncbi:EAL domain-containing protein [Halomonas sp. HP20-15]|uniref:putative bifunctional diguanylate cyclase/phosphodiesterase n=1 Tax=Halomonas sp. HP20-15 TaxID=3085901 RepID=UPI00298141A5|nr:EAL domain-containing protein [Halomonas sp. HP20-15]MDW5377486.1 EAL domain-containing protein [Halomonas sp. HP20-15]
MPDRRAILASRILVADDDPAASTRVAALLAAQGYNNVDRLDEPARLNEHLHRHPTDLILLAVRPPPHQGLELISRLRSQAGLQGPPVIALTEPADGHLRGQALKLGARDCLTRPFDQLEAVQRVHNALRSRRLYRQRDNQAAELEILVDRRTAELERLALEEPITGLPNRRALLNHLQRCLAHEPPSGYLLFIALDGLDDIARLHGYPASDALLGHACRLIDGHIADSDMLGCWGGAELLMVCQSLSNDDDVFRRAEAIRDALARDHLVDDLLVSLGCRIGISHAGVDAPGADQLVRLATLALPPQGAPAVRAYAVELEQRHQKRARMQQLMREAAPGGELHLVYQPKVYLPTGRMVGVEALVRWHSAELGMISPGEFVPLAEANGDILAIGDWVVDEAIRQLAEWRERGHVDEHFSIAINVATRQLMHSDFAVRLLSRLQRADLPAHALQVEVTESGLMEDVAVARQTLQTLADQGIKVAIDDFGTGYSSLAYLKTLPVTTLKIDRTFIRDMLHNSHDRSLSNTVIRLAHSFDCDVVAEGIEQRQQAELLASLGCEYAQGYWFSRPLAAGDFLAWKRRYEARPHDRQPSDTPPTLGSRS